MSPIIINNNIADLKRPRYTSESEQFDGQHLGQHLVTTPSLGHSVHLADGFEDVPLTTPSKSL